MPDFAADAERSRPEKVALRSRLLAARAAMTASDRRSAATSVQAAILDLVRRTRPAVIAAYVPVATEPGGADLPSVLVAHARVLLPLLLDDADLDWAEFDGALHPGPRGLRQPGGPRLGVDAVRSAGLVLVPAVAVDGTGLRLGRGGGSYDRVLARIAPETMTVALLYDNELVESVPAEAHDRTVHAVITPSTGLVLCGSPDRRPA